MLKIGLTGGIGSGKTTVADMFAALDVMIIDADAIAHDITQPHTNLYHDIITYFGTEIVNSDKSLNRKMLRHIVFNDQEKKSWLEEKLHPAISTMMREQINTATGSYCILVIPLLIESKKIDFVDRVLLVDSPEALQIARVIQRDDSNAESIKTIMQSQCSREQRLAAADDTINNDGNLQQLRSKVDKLHHFYLQLAADEN